MFLCDQCWSEINKGKQSSIPCFGPGNHIDPNLIPELTGRNVSIVLKDGIQTFAYDTRGDKGGLETVYMPLETHPRIFRQDPPGENAPALF